MKGDEMGIIVSKTNLNMNRGLDELKRPGRVKDEGSLSDQLSDRNLIFLFESLINSLNWGKTKKKTWNGLISPGYFSPQNVWYHSTQEYLIF